MWNNIIIMIIILILIIILHILAVVVEDLDPESVRNNIGYMFHRNCDIVDFILNSIDIISIILFVLEIIMVFKCLIF